MKKIDTSKIIELATTKQAKYSEEFEDIIEVGKPYIEVLEKLVSEIKLVKTLIYVLKLPQSVSDIILANKVSSFLYKANLNEDRIEKLMRTLSKQDNKKLWEKIVLSINNHDQIERTEITGKLFKALSDDIITKDQFYAMVHATNNVNLNNLEGLIPAYDLDEDLLPTSDILGFVNFGLLGMNMAGIGGYDFAGITYPMTQLGWKYLGIVYDYPDSKIAPYKIGEGDLIGYLESGPFPNRGFPIKYMDENKLKYKKYRFYFIMSEDVLFKNDLPYTIEIINKMGDGDHAVFRILADTISVKIKYKPIPIHISDIGHSAVHTFVLKLEELPEGIDPVPISLAIGNVQDISDSEEKKLVSNTLGQIRVLLRDQPDDLTIIM